MKHQTHIGSYHDLRKQTRREGEIGFLLKRSCPYAKGSSFYEWWKEGYEQEKRKEQAYKNSMI